MIKKDIVVISLFDGLSGGRLATDRVENLNVLRYYSSEIDKYAIQVADHNYPQDKAYRLGSVVDVDGYKLKEEVKRDFGDVDILLVGGSPCQGFSMAGKLKGSATKCGQDVVTLEQYLDLKEQQFEFDGQSYLFWEYIRIMKELNPKYFMLENVRVTKKWLPMFNEAMGVEPMRINSSLVSAQNRDRYYWHNLGEIPQPDDDRKFLVVRDILEYDGYPNPNNEKIDTIVQKVKVRKNKVDIKKLQLILRQNRKPVKYLSKILNQPLTKVEHWFRTDDSFSIPSEDIWYKLKHELNIKTDEFDSSIMEFEIKDGKFDMADRIYGTNYKAPTVVSSNVTKVNLRPCELKEFNEKSSCHHAANATDIKGNESIKRVYAETGKAPAMTTCASGHREPKVLVDREKSYCIDANYFRGGNPEQYFNKCRRQLVFPNNGATYRKLTPLECERLQTLPDNYTLVSNISNKQLVSDSQRYKMIGNGWTIDVVAYILKHLIKSNS